MTELIARRPIIATVHSEVRPPQLSELDVVEFEASVCDCEFTAANGVTYHYHHVNTFMPSFSVNVDNTSVGYINGDPLIAVRKIKKSPQTWIQIDMRHFKMPAFKIIVTPTSIYDFTQVE